MPLKWMEYAPNACLAGMANRPTMRHETYGVLHDEERFPATMVCPYFGFCRGRWNLGIATPHGRRPARTT